METLSSLWVVEGYEEEREACDLRGCLRASVRVQVDLCDQVSVPVREVRDLEFGRVGSIVRVPSEHD